MLSYIYNTHSMAYSSFYARIYDQIQSTRKSLVSVWKFAPTKVYLLAILLIQILVWIQAITIFRNFSDNLIILHYNIDFGVDLIGEPSRILYFPIAGLGVIILNFLLATIFVRQLGAKILVHLLFSTSIIVNVFLSLVLVALYLINFQ